MKKQGIILFMLLTAALWGAPRKAVAQIFAVRANALAACSATPVSYTHLDVYKRQVL